MWRWRCCRASLAEPVFEIWLLTFDFFEVGFRAELTAQPGQSIFFGKLLEIGGEPGEP